MLFCPNCQNLLNISKNILANISDELETPKTVSHTTTDIKKQLKSGPLSTGKSTNINTNKAYYVCTTCFYYELIHNNSLITSGEYIEQLVDYDVYKDGKYSPIIPRTCAYICANKSCETHKNNKNKEAIFFRINSEQMDTYYMCTICDTIWKI